MKYVNDYKNQMNKKKVMINANNKCRLCNRKAVLVHHKDFSNDNHDINNLIALCRYCHLRLHWEENRSKYKIEFIKILAKVQR